MNITQAKQGLTSCIERVFSLSYGDGADVESGDEIQVYGCRYISNGEINWRIKNIYKGHEEITITESVGIDKGRQQLILKMTVDNVSKRDNTVSDIVTVDRSEIVKNKYYILNTVLQLWYIGWNTKYIDTNSGKVSDLDESIITSEKIRPVNKNDFKITTVSSQRKSMHLGHTSISQNYNFKLGVNWVYWHRMSPTEKLKVLTHEICHCTHSHHRESFYEEHAKFIAKLSSSKERKERVELLFDGEINWNELKTKTLDGVHNQPKEIDISGYQHRREACNSIIKSLETILNYEYEIGSMFYLYPPETLYFDWQYETLFDNEVSQNLDEVRPENVQSMKVKNLDYNDDYTDEELFNYINSQKRDEYSITTEYVFSKEDIPHVDEDNNVIKNDKLVSLYNRLIMESKRKGFPEDVEILVIQ